jgi:hypothetical protein
MAGDLIPPPSPAGRPPPDPEFEPIPEPEDGEPEAAPAAAGGGSREALPSPYRARFGFITGVLLGCGIAAAVLLLVVLTSGGPRDEGLARDWSTWHPDTTESFNGAYEIARHIQAAYHNEKKKPLASVTSGPIAFGQIPLTVAIPDGDDVRPLYGVGVQYTLGGSGRAGLLKDSKPSKERRLLLRREALELSLYSFRYLPDVTMVVTLMPPAPKAEQVHPEPKGRKAAAKAAKVKQPRYQDQAIFYRPGDLKSQLEIPLKFTMSPATPTIRGFDGEEADRVESLTIGNLFEYVRRPGSDGRAYLLLQRPGS